MDDARARKLVGDWFDFIWRALRRLGVPVGMADDAAQQVFLVAAGKIVAIPRAGEQRFLLAIALRVAADVRRLLRRRPDILGEELVDAADAGPDLDELADRRRARAIIDAVLETMPLELRLVFFLFELEEMTTAEIAGTLGLRHGTVASRLRRSRELFDRGISRWKAKASRRLVGGEP